jgi:lysozyme family protein
MHDEDVRNPDKPEISEWTPLAYRQEYIDLWLTMRQNLIGKQVAGTITWTVNYIKAHQARYEKASDLCFEKLGKRIPWQLIGALHMRESSGNFKKQIMNGQPYTQKTTWVPKGYGPWNSWEDACVDAFKIKALPDKWTIANTLYFSERFNGMGYRNNSRAKIVGYSPYIWAYTQHYKGGYYVSDGKFSASATAMGVGVAMILKQLGFKGES